MLISSAQLFSALSGRCGLFRLLFQQCGKRNFLPPVLSSEMGLLASEANLANGAHISSDASEVYHGPVPLVLIPYSLRVLMTPDLDVPAVPHSLTWNRLNDGKPAAEEKMGAIEAHVPTPVPLLVQPNLDIPREAKLLSLTPRTSASTLTEAPRALEASLKVRKKVSDSQEAAGASISHEFSVMRTSNAQVKITMYEWHVRGKLGIFEEEFCRNGELKRSNISQINSDSDNGR
ncbi:hypothetical protein B0H11DRAFT_1930737 [Mycena galericulata]|nr:hypothetical protein B0H11DRAFT_1930737 [Mycena galericulata]